MGKKVGLVSLGCPKNQVDAERLLAALSENGYEVADDVDGADLVIVNTCAFIEDAKKEAIENILDMAQLKKDGIIGRIVVTGCLAERYRDEILSEIPEADAVIGLGSNAQIAGLCERVLAGERVRAYGDKTALPFEGGRILTTPPYLAYLKIAEGCSNACTYCAIPSIRGKFRSRPAESILKEAAELAGRGVKELVVVAQDTTRYGEDLYGRPALPALLTALSKIEGFEWIRVLYLCPERITDELLGVFAANGRLLNYMDIPIQHVNSDILRRMGRKSDRESLLALIRKIRAKLPDAVLRTTVIAGFPGETEEAFEELCAFVEEVKFDRLGCFAYSPEEGTPAAGLPGQLDGEVRLRRAEIVSEQQSRIFEELGRRQAGRVLRTVVEGYDGYTDSYYGRTWRDAPEIDGIVRFTCGCDLRDGDFADVKIFDAEDGDLIGEAV